MKISVIVPAYNSESTIERCLKSLIKQTYNNMEIIVINDGSTDKTDEIIRRIVAENFDKIKYISRENKGIGFTRNEGLKNATGDLIGFTDSDDFVEPDMFEKMFLKMTESNADIVICNYNVCNLNSKNKVDIKLPNIVSFDDYPQIINKIDFAPWNKLYKKELFNDVFFPENLKYEDLNTIIKVFSKSKKIVKLNDYLYNYLINSNGETVTINDKIYDIFSIFDDLFSYFDSSDKKIQKQLKLLCLRKLFIYTELSLNNKDINFTAIFLEKVYQYLNIKIKSWKILYLLNSNNLKVFILRFMQVNKKLYMFRLNRKLKAMR